jgi:hypothetical protein
MTEENRVIINREEYLKCFSNMDGSNQGLKQSEALKSAHDIRKFEIDLYWRRATYFWAFIAASFTGYFALVTISVKPNGLDAKYLVLVSVLGFIFSYSWYFVNRGSKYWQNNWERHVDYLENEITGPLYKAVRNPRKSKLYNFVGEYPFSVSKINQILSLMITFIWIIIMFDATTIFLNNLNPFVVAFIELCFIALITLILGYYGRSKMDYNQSQGEPKFIIREFE